MRRDNSLLRVAAGALPAVLLAFAAAACSSNPSSTSTSTSAPVATTGPTSTTATTAPLPDVCSLVPARKVAALIGTSTSSKSSSFTEANIHKRTAGCEYDYGTSGDAVNIDVTPGATAQDFHADSGAAGLNPSPISGLGDEATSDGTVGVYVLSGTYLINVQGTPQQANGDFSQEVTLARDVIAALPGT
jgi:hypothetical protein